MDDLDFRWPEKDYGSLRSLEMGRGIPQRLIQAIRQSSPLSEPNVSKSKSRTFSPSLGGHNLHPYPIGLAA